MERRFVAIDPGVNNGWCEYDDGLPKAMGTITTEKDLKSFNEWIKTYDDIKLWVVEDYLIRYGIAAKGYQHQWNPVIAARVIGAITNFASQRDAEVVLQQPSIIPAAARMIGFELPKGHLPDMYSAMLHGAYYYYKEHPDAAPPVKSGRGAPPETGLPRSAGVAQISGWRRPPGKRRGTSLGM